MDWKNNLQRLNYILVPNPGKMGRINRLMYRLFRQNVTFIGRLILACLLVLGPTAVTVTTRTPLYLFVLFLVALLFFTRLAQLAFYPRVSVTRSLPPRAPCNVPIEVHASVTNLRGLPLYDIGLTEQACHGALSLQEQPDYVATIPPGATSPVRYSITPKHRGIYDMRGPLALSAFPFGFYHQSYAVASPHRMHVYPSYHPLRELKIPIGRRHQPGGLELVSQIGESEEYHGNREYRPGDPLRDLDHKAWARVGHPIVREYREEYICRIALAVDTCSRQKPFYEDLEAGLSLAASIAEFLCRQDVLIDLFAAGPNLYQLKAGRSLAYLEQILDILACIDPSSSTPFEHIAPEILTQAEETSAVFVIMLDWSEDRIHFVDELQRLGLLPRVFIVRSGPTTIDAEGMSTKGGPIVRLTPQDLMRGVDSL